MSKLVTKTLQFDADGIEGIKGFNVYYCKEVEGPLNYEKPFVFIPVVVGKTAYSLVLPGTTGMTDGSYILGVAAVDTEGNISDISAVTYFFDFTPPKKPLNVRVG